jgi:hypothetical protein
MTIIGNQLIFKFACIDLSEVCPSAVQTRVDSPKLNPTAKH